MEDTTEADVKILKDNLDQLFFLVFGFIIFCEYLVFPSIQTFT